MCAIKFSIKEIRFYCVERFIFLKFNTNFAQPANIDRNAIRGETITKKKKQSKRNLASDLNTIFFCLDAFHGQCRLIPTAR